MPEWLLERGIGESRYALIEAGEIIEARIELDEVVRAGSIVAARLIQAASRNAVARDEVANEYLLPHGAPGVTEGAQLNIEIMREAIPGSEPWKRPLARLSDNSPRPQVKNDEIEVRSDLGAAGWDDLLDQARSGTVSFLGGELRISPTPAMTLIDVDGYLPAEELAIAGAREAARAIRKLDIAGSIGIDLPTAPSKAARHAAAAAIDTNLPQPFERTAVNGFGFVQVVRPRKRASLIELAQDRAAFETRAFLRRTAAEPPGGKQLVAHPAVIAILEQRPEWTNALSRQIGGAISLRAEPALPISGSYAERL